MARKPWLKQLTSKRLFLPMSIMVVILVLFMGRTVDLLSLIQQPLARLGTAVYNQVFLFTTAGNILPEELDALYDQRDAYIVDQTEFQQLQDDYAALKELLGFVERSNYTTVAANITGRSIGPESDRFLIDRGESDGVRVGQAVVVGNGLIVGKVSDVGPFTATVAVLADQGTALAVSLFNETRTIGLVEGVAGNLLAMSFIPDEEQIEVNDIVVTSGLEELIPSGLIVGSINAVVADEQTPFQEAYVEPITDARRHQQVLVLITDAL